MARNYNGLFAGLAQGLSTNVDRYTAYKEKLAELEMAKQKALEVEKAKRAVELPQEALKSFDTFQQHTRAYSAVEPGPNGTSITKTYPAMDPAAAASYYSKLKDVYGANLPDVQGAPGAAGPPKTPPDSHATAETRRTWQFLKKDFEDQSKPFSAAVSAYTNAQAHAKMGTAVGDTQLVYDLIQAAQGKAQVSDADVAAFAAQGGLSDKAQAAYLKAKNGQRFDPAIKKQIMDSLEGAYRNQEALHAQREKDFTEKATLAGADPKLIISPLRPPEQAPDPARVSQLLSIAPGKMTQDEMTELLKYNDYFKRKK